MTTKKEQLFYSEDLGPMAAHCIGRWFKECEEADPESLGHYCERFWWGMNALKKLSTVTGTSRERDGAVHFSLAMSNELNHVAEYIESKTGENPLDRPRET